MVVSVPNWVETGLKTLKNSGFFACLVGGCVRDFALNLPPKDYDIGTNATPNEIKMAFSGCKTIDIGAKYGTIIVIIDGHHLEITTFRTDGAYLGGRKPEAVTFTQSIAEDLSRRDFTINAMAWDGALIDPFGGLSDLKNKKIRTVGCPKTRFEEDGLRILRGLRFAATYDFEVEPQTAAAMGDSAFMLGKISGERIGAELLKLMTGTAAHRVLGEFVNILTVVIPEIIPCVNFDQKSKNHIFDVYTHTLKAIEHAPQDEIVRLALLLHDLGKPKTFTLDSKGSGHFYNHGVEGEKMARGILQRLRYDKKLINQVLTLIKYHDYDLLETPKSLSRWLALLGEEALKRLIVVKKCDNLAQNPAVQTRQESLKMAECNLEKLLKSNPFLGVKSLALSGQDLLKLGLEGPAVGKMQTLLADAVFDEKVSNTKEDLIEYVKKLLP